MARNIASSVDAYQEFGLSRTLVIINGTPFRSVALIQ